MDEGAPTGPAATAELIGHDAAEQELLAAMGGRLHHAWLLTGIRGIGKATLAYRFARKLLADAHDGPGGGPGLFGDEPAGPTSLYVPPEHPTFQRVATGGHGDLMVIERGIDPKTGKMRTEIPVDEVRRLNRFFSMTGAETGKRIAIIDAVDELNRNAANAFLKILEEPPEDALLLLIAHRPGRLLPTIRSRCRRLALSPLSSAQVEDYLAHHHPEIEAPDRRAVAGLAMGSIGRAESLSTQAGIEVLEAFNKLAGHLADARAAEIHKLADLVTGRDSDAKYRIFEDLLRDWITARTVDEGQSGEGTRPAHLDQWFDLWEKVSHLSERTEAVHLDRKQVVITLMLGAQTAMRQG